jgi:hypothetical protein
LRDLQEPNSRVLIDAAPEHTSPILGQGFVDGYSASVPRMPRVTDFSRFNIMGVVLSTRTTRSALMKEAKYIGLGVHQATIFVAILDSAGKLVMEAILETKSATILQFICGLRSSGT